MFLKVLSLFLLFFSFHVFSTTYSRGEYSCSQEYLEDVEGRYNNKPEYGGYAVAYAKCLIIKGEDERGLSLLRNVIEQEVNVPAGFFLARYIQSNGFFDTDTTRDYDKLNETISAYLYVLAAIDMLGTSYPLVEGKTYFWNSEVNVFVELSSHYEVTGTYFQKFVNGARGIYRFYLMQSSSYEGDRDLNTYPEYSPYTIDSLNKTVEFADRCIDLPEKQYFYEIPYKVYREACRILKEAALSLLPLEMERLKLLNEEACSGDLPNCKGYNDLADGKMVPIVHKAYDEMDVIFKELDQFVNERDARLAQQREELERQFAEEDARLEAEYQARLKREAEERKEYMRRSQERTERLARELRQHLLEECRAMESCRNP